MEQGQGSVERVAVEELPEAPAPTRASATVVNLVPPRVEAPTLEPVARTDPPPSPPPPLDPISQTPAPIPAPDLRPSPVVAALRVIARILAVRLILLLSVLGGFVLGVMAMLAQTWPSLAILTAWSLLTVLPLVWLEVGQRPKGD